MSKKPTTNEAILHAIALLTEIYREDSNAILAADLDGRNIANPPAVYAATVAQLLALAK